MSLRKAINAKCRECIYDRLAPGTAAQQIACCVAADCPLHSVRPITTSTIPESLLEAYRMNAMELDTRAKGLIRFKDAGPGSGQIGLLLDAESISEADSPVIPSELSADQPEVPLERAE